MRIIRRDGLRSTPWKNGGGETRQIACFPPASQLHDFEWRLSTAVVATDGDFSFFEGVDRRLYLLGGNGLGLRLGSQRVRRLTTGDYIDFPGELPVHGSLIDGPVVDLTIMWRRDRLRANIGDLSISDTTDILLPWEVVAVFVRSGDLRVADGSSSETANPFDTVILDKGHADRSTLEGPAEVIVIGIDPLKLGAGD